MYMPSKYIKIHCRSTNPRFPVCNFTHGCADRRLFDLKLDVLIAVWFGILLNVVLIVIAVGASYLDVLIFIFFFCVERDK